MTDTATRPLTEAELVDAQARSIDNRSRLTGRCGCFHCMSTFPADRIARWIDDGQTALCPVCDIDAILPEADGGTSLGLLEQMHRRWFAPSNPATPDEWQRALDTGQPPHPRA